MTTKTLVQTLPNDSSHANKGATTNSGNNDNTTHNVTQTISPSREALKQSGNDTIPHIVTHTDTNKGVKTNAKTVTNTGANTMTKQESVQAKVLPVDINITGKVYTINCPVAEVKELEKATTYINSFIQDIRANAPQLTHENLLVLCCLNLYEQMQQTKEAASVKAQVSQQAQSLVERMIKDMHIL